MNLGRRRLRDLAAAALLSLGLLAATVRSEEPAGPSDSDQSQTTTESVSRISLPSSDSVKTKVFGIEAEGSKFVYVFDRSSSMAGAPLRTAKAELIASLESLGDVQQFYIIFYNHEPKFFSPGGPRGRLIFGNDQNKRSAKHFIEGMAADGATQHSDAMKMALRLQADVIFLLTDGDSDDDLSPEDLDELTRRNDGRAVINIIQFSAEQEGNRLVRLAEQNGGRHAYVDISGGK